MGEGVYYYRNERLYILTTDEGMPDNYVYDLEQDKQGNVWLSTDGGIAKLSLNTEGKYDIAIFEYAQGLPDNIVKALTYDGKEAFWVGMQDGGLAKIAIAEVHKACTSNASPLGRFRRNSTCLPGERTTPVDVPSHKFPSLSSNTAFTRT